MPKPMTWLLPLLLLLPALPGHAAEHSCVAPTGIAVATDDPETFSEICDAANRAIAFLARYGLEPKRPIAIDVVEEKIENHGYLSYGRYQSDIDRIQLMSYAAIFANTEKPMIYEEPFDRVHYAGLIAHEVAHAVFDHNLKNRKFSTVPQEYLAHATQLAVLPEARRNALIKAMKVGAWQGGDSVSHIYMAMNPGRFAVKSYLHLTSLTDPAPFIKQLLNNNWLYVDVPKD